MNRTLSTLSTRSPLSGARTTKRWVLASAVALVALVGMLSASEREAAAQGKKGVITISEVTIVGRVQKPIASVDVSKISAKLTLAELRQPFLDRIEEAVQHDPF